jgi:predicted transcriptional regulator
MSEITDPHEQLNGIAATLRAGGVPPPITVRAFLKWFNAQRRGAWIVRDIRRNLKRVGLTTAPDFESAWIDGPVSFELADVRTKPRETPDRALSADGSNNSTAATSPAHSETESGETFSPGAAEAVGRFGNSGREASEQVATAPAFTTPVPAGGSGAITSPSLGTDLKETSGSSGDPTHRISKLEAANRRPVSVSPDSTLIEAVTLMLANNFSQVPVMIGDRIVKGVVTWHSIGSRLALGCTGSTAREVMDDAVEIRSDASIFAAIPDLVEHGYVLVRGPDERIVGIVTSSDLSQQFRQLAEPFLLLSEIENRIRNIIGPHFGVEELAAIRDPDDDERRIESVDKMSFGEYIRLLEEPSRWTRVDLRVDRKNFIKSLDNIRKIRNDVMHFDTDELPKDDTLALRDFARFLQRLETIGVT